MTARLVGCSVVCLLCCAASALLHPSRLGCAVLCAVWCCMKFGVGGDAAFVEHGALNMAKQHVETIARMQRLRELSLVRACACAFGFMRA